LRDVRWLVRDDLAADLEAKTAEPLGYGRSTAVVTCAAGDAIRDGEDERRQAVNGLLVGHA
jgi:hypothetical protein